MNPIESIQSQIRHLEQEYRSIYSNDKESIQTMLSDRYSALNKIAFSMKDRFRFRQVISKQSINMLKIL